MLFLIFLVSLGTLTIILRIDEEKMRRQKQLDQQADVRNLADAVARHGKGARPEPAAVPVVETTETMDTTEVHAGSLK